MQTEVITALIGACGTVVAAALGGYATIAKGPGGVERARPARQRIGFIILAIGAVLALLTLSVGFVLGRSQEAKRAIVEREAKVSSTLTTYRELVESGFQAGKKYIIPASVMLVDLEKSPDGQRIESERHMIYSVQALSDIKKDDRQFVESYHSLFPFERIPGSDDERMIEKNPTMKSWNVRFDANDGDRHTILTGANGQTPIKITTNHDQHMFDGLAPNEDAFCYPNDDGDVMEELLIVIESHTLKLSLREDVDNARSQNGNEVKRVEATLRSDDENGYRHQVAVARFNNVKKGEVDGLRIGWHQ